MFKCCLAANSKENGFDSWEEIKATTRNEAVLFFLMQGLYDASPAYMKAIHVVKVKYHGRTWLVKGAVRFAPFSAVRETKCQ